MGLTLGKAYIYPRGKVVVDTSPSLSLSPSLSHLFPLPSDLQKGRPLNVHIRLKGGGGGGGVAGWDAWIRLTIYRLVVGKTNKIYRHALTSRSQAVCVCVRVHLWPFFPWRPLGKAVSRVIVLLLCLRQGGERLAGRKRERERER